MIRILFLDDQPDRHAVFGRASGGNVVVHVETAADAVAALKRQEFDLVYLDHDLGGRESEGLMLDGVEDGRWVARWIAENAEFFSDTRFIVHSLNQAAASSMVSTLRDAGLRVDPVPFGWEYDPLVLLVA